MPFINSIASRIFGLAIILVCLMILLAGFLLWQVTALDHELQQIAGYYAPLDECLGDLNEAGLKRRIAFERWYGALGSSVDHKQAIAEATASYEAADKIIETESRRAEELLSHPPAKGTARQDLVRIETTLAHIDSTYAVIEARQHDIVRFLEQGDAARAADLQAVVSDLQHIVEEERSDIQNSITALLALATQGAARRHSEVFWTTIFATLTSVLLGLSVAALVTRRLVLPVRSLMKGIQTVEKGDLTVQLPVRSGDEIGNLTRSFNYFITEMRLKEDLRSTFGKYIDPRILERIILDPASTGAAGGRQDMAVSFADLVGFTEIGEQLTPAGVVNLLNEHFTLQAEAIQRDHGVVDKFMGDAVMAFWGAPFAQENEHAALACRGALHQARAIESLQARLPEITGLRKNLPNLSIRIGISTGEVIVGNIGSENTRSYTVIGDTVNLASRLEHANRFYGTRILICETTRREAGEAIVAREVDTIVVKGKTETTRIFELLSLAGDATEEMVALGERSSAALTAYRAREWDAAERIFRETLSHDAGDGPAQLFLKRIAEFRLDPPAADWNGTWIYDVK